MARAEEKITVTLRMISKTNPGTIWIHMSTMECKLILKTQKH